LAGRRNAAVFAVVAVVVVAGLTAFALSSLGRQGSAPCALPRGAVATRSQLHSVQFGAVEEYALPQPSRWSNAITLAPDGSVWFGEQAVPGVGHLFLNGTLVEYPWPSSKGAPAGSCGYRTGIWGIEPWNGMVWAADSDENALIGVNPTSGTTTVVNVTGMAPEPYTLAIGPDGSLWFTTLSQRAVLGRLLPNLTATAYPVNVSNGEVPLQIQFVNSSYAYFVALNPLKPYGHLYSFDPAVSGKAIDAVQVGGRFQILEPASVTASGSSVWMTQHGASDVVEYDTSTGNWTVFPTSTANYTATTLPYFIEAQGQEVWFNEHYANRIALLGPDRETLTEYSEANPPIENGSFIQNDLTIAPGDGGLWFTSVTGNYIGFVNGSVRDPFSLMLLGTDSATVARGATANLTLLVDGSWPGPLRVQASDSEDYGSVPDMIRIVPSAQHLQQGSGPTQFQVAVTPETGISPGRYTVAVTVSDGLLSQTVYFFLNVS